jgi:Ran GTPase-activating protein (RanGAP) involved in mRNA processing and transport
MVNCPALAQLDLRVNCIKSYGAGKLAGVLAQCTALAHLDLSGNWIGDRGTGKLAGVLAQCSALPHLDLNDNPIGDGAQRLIESWSGPEGGLGRKLLR